MQHPAKLSGNTLEVGAALLIQGTTLRTGDVVTISNAEDKLLRANVTGFGLARLVLEIGGTQIELRPWNRYDDMLLAADGPGSQWTVRNVAAA